MWYCLLACVVAIITTCSAKAPKICRLLLKIADHMLDNGQFFTLFPKHHAGQLDLLDASMLPADFCDDQQQTSLGANCVTTLLADIDERFAEIAAKLAPDLKVTKVEDGYFTFREPGAAMSNLHQDNNFASMETIGEGFGTRAASLIISLWDEWRLTAFPLAKVPANVSFAGFRPVRVGRAQEEAEVADLATKLQRAWLANPEQQRTMSFDENHEPFSHTIDAVGSELLIRIRDRALAMCEIHTPAPAIRAGDALLFYSVTPDNEADPHALHGSCAQKHLDKLILAKFLQGEFKGEGD